MQYFFTVEHSASGAARGLMGSETAFLDFYGHLPPELQGITFGEPDGLKGEPPPKHCLFVIPRESILEEFATPFIRMEG